MARVVRTCWAFDRPKRYGNFPGQIQRLRMVGFDYEAMQSTLFDYPEKLEQAPKLWVVWLYQNSFLSNRFVKDDVKFIFGKKNPELNKIRIVKNTPYYNTILWRIKHLIEVRPLRFPDGEPTEEDVEFVQVKYNGDCIINRKLNDGVTFDLEQKITKKEFGRREMMGFLKVKWSRCVGDMNEDNPWNDQNYSRM